VDQVFTVERVFTVVLADMDETIIIVTNELNGEREFILSPFLFQIIYE
jgi:hypothetical protein